VFAHACRLGAEGIEEAARQSTDRSIRLRHVAVVISVVSLAAFIAWACLAAWALAPLRT
jgi:hypothetical protein